MGEIINDFDNEHYFLSNFTFAPFVKDNVTWDTVEHYFQAMKTTDLQEREKIRLAGCPRFAKKLGRQVQLRSDWEQIKYQVMLDGVRAKFTQNTQFADLLRATGLTFLEEGNWWHDNIWGNCACLDCRGIMGQNLLGLILIKVRAELEIK